MNNLNDFILMLRRNMLHKEMHKYEKEAWKKLCYTREGEGGAKANELTKISATKYFFILHMEIRRK